MNGYETKNMINQRAPIFLILIGFAGLIVLLVGSLFVFQSPFARRIIGPCLLAAVVGLIVFAGFMVLGKWGSEDPHQPMVVASLPDEMSASALVVQLEAHGINARAVGGFTAGDVVCDVKVVVPAEDHELAMGMLQIIEEDQA